MQGVGWLESMNSTRASDSSGGDGVSASSIGLGPTPVGATSGKGTRSQQTVSPLGLVAIGGRSATQRGRHDVDRIL